MRDKATEAEKSLNVAENFDPTEMAGRPYIARTIKYRSGDGGDERGTGSFYQTGCSPNYAGDLWTLACCKHDMRQSSSFRDNFELAGEDTGMRIPNRPVFVFVVASKDGSDAQYLASVSLVTQAFERMTAYGAHLQEHETQFGHAANRRSTGTDDDWAAEFGDCHVDLENTMVSPPPSHPHYTATDGLNSCTCTSSGAGNDPERHDDNRSDHYKCISDPGYWLAYDEPTFETTETINQGYRNIEEFDEVRDLLTETSTQ